MSSETELTKLIVPVFSKYDAAFPNNPVLSWPLILIVPLFVILAFSADIPTALFPVKVILPVVSFTATAFVNVVEGLLFFANIPVPPSPSDVISPLLRIFTFPWPNAAAPNSSTTLFPLESVLYATPNIPIESFPLTFILPSAVTSEPLTEYIPTPPAFTVLASFSIFIVDEASVFTFP